MATNRTTIEYNLSVGNNLISFPFKYIDGVHSPNQDVTPGEFKMFGDGGLISQFGGVSGSLSIENINQGHLNFIFTSGMGCFINQVESSGSVDVVHQMGNLTFLKGIAGYWVNVKYPVSASLSGEKLPKSAYDNVFNGHANALISSPVYTSTPLEDVLKYGQNDFNPTYQYLTGIIGQGIATYFDPSYTDGRAGNLNNLFPGKGYWLLGGGNSAPTNIFTGVDYSITGSQPSELDGGDWPTNSESDATNGQRGIDYYQLQPGHRMGHITNFQDPNNLMNGFYSGKNCRLFVTENDAIVTHSNGKAVLPTFSNQDGLQGGEFFTFYTSSVGGFRDSLGQPYTGSVYLGIFRSGSEGPSSASNYSNTCCGASLIYRFPGSDHEDIRAYIEGSLPPGQTADHLPKIIASKVGATTETASYSDYADITAYPTNKTSYEPTSKVTILAYIPEFESGSATGLYPVDYYYAAMTGSAEVNGGNVNKYIKATDRLFVYNNILIVSGNISGSVNADGHGQYFSKTTSGSYGNSNVNLRYSYLQVAGSPI